MAKSIGFSRNIKLEWLDKTVELIKSDKSNREISEELLSYLSFEIGDKTNLQKTKNILLNIWVNSADDSRNIRDFALKVFDFKNDERIILHWCMMLLAYPVFRDIVQIIGRTCFIQSKFTVKSAKARMFDSWGERSTLYFSFEKMLQTMKNMNLIENIEAGVYKPVETQISKNEYILVILLSILSINKGTYYELHDLQESPLHFPFSYILSYEVVQECELITFEYFNSKKIIRIREVT